MFAQASSYKPSPLSFNSPRASPFRRPSSPTVAQRPSTPPNQSPGRNNHTTPTTSPSKLKQSYTAEDADSDTRTAAPPSPTPLSRTFTRSQTEPPPSPPARSITNNPPTPMSARSRGPTAANADVLSRLPPQLLHSLREAFSVLDRDSDGQVDRSDVVDVLNSLGMDSSSATIAPFFPPGSPQTLTLPSFLNTLGTMLIGLSPPQELLNAFAAFDDDDSGQVDVSELKDALIHTAPDHGVRVLTERDVDTAIEGFTGRRAFGRGHNIALHGMKGMGNGMGVVAQKKGDVFKYTDFVGNLVGGQTNGQSEAIRT
ncbi:MAG: hypothetical protein Q9227_002423 [Pyrenula ochraceoflavens]